MTATDTERRYTPLVILGLVSALVLVIALWVMGVGGKQASAPGTADPLGTGELIQWKLVTTWPKNFPGLGMGPVNFARLVEDMSGGRMQVHVYGAGEMVPAFGVFDAVSQGVAEAGHGASYYWTGKIPASFFFTAAPFGLNAQEMNGWLHYGGGLELWRELYAPFNLVPFAGGNSGTQMAGWFNKEINTVEDLKGLKMRIPGPGGEVFTRAGGTAVVLPGGELYTSMQTGVIDATEWVGPYNDIALGLHEVAKYYYYPGWHESGPTLEFIVNRDALERLPDDLRAIVEVATRAVNQDMLDEFTARNNAALQDLVNRHGVELRRLPDDVLNHLRASSDEIMAELVAEDPMAAKIFASWERFLGDVSAYHAISEQAYINARTLVREGD